MQLKVKTETTHFVDYRDFDAFVQHHTGRKDYESVPLQEWSNDSDKVFNVGGTPNKFDKRDFEAFKAGTHDGAWLAQTILNALCAEGKLPAGKYTIRVSW